MSIKSGTDSPPTIEPADWLTRAAEHLPQVPALYCGERIFSYQQLLRLCRDIATDIDAQGQDGRPMALACRSPLDTALGFWAGLYCRTTVLPLRSDHPETSRLLEQCGPGLWMADNEDAHPLVCRRSSAGLPAPVSRDIRLIIATSGSTGEPRGVMLTAANLAAAVGAANSRTPLHAGDIWLACLPLEHIGGLSILLRCAHAGAAVLLHPDHDPTHILHDLERFAVTHLSLTPAMLHLLLEASGGAPPPMRLRTLLLGGAALSPGLAQRATGAGWPLCVSYGMSETASQVATRCWAAAPACAGRPLHGFDVSIGNPNGAGVGEIRLRGPALMAGYANPSLRPGLGLRDGWLHTGDLGHLDRKGWLHVLGRADDLLNSGGVRLHPVEVEPVLRVIPGVDDALLSARKDPVWGDLLVAVYTGMATPEAVLAHCRKHLPKTHLPRDCRQLDRLPYLPSGKPDRRRLRIILETTGRPTALR